jgi:hypothetical protein
LQDWQIFGVDAPVITGFLSHLSYVFFQTYDHYSDFGPTLAAEKLRERHDISVSVETLRKWMTADGLWVPMLAAGHGFINRDIGVTAWRTCSDRWFPHDWFEGRAPKYCLLVFIDDATGRLMHLRFSESETAFDYMLATREYIEQHGKPVSLYSDKHAYFSVNNGRTTTTVTQFGRVLSELAIELICANSSAAKGRVERANQTLQDRLIKEMRLDGITDIEAANAWLDIFIADFNRRFARPARFPKDLHRPVAESNEELRDIFAWHDVRTVSKSLTFQYDKILYLIDPTEENSRLAGEKIKVLDYPDGTLAFHYGHRSLKCQAFDKLACVDQGQIVDNKRLGTVLRLAQVKQDERESEGKRERSKKSPSRRLRCASRNSSGLLIVVARNRNPSDSQSAHISAHINCK